VQQGGLACLASLSTRPILSPEPACVMPSRRGRAVPCCCRWSRELRDERGAGSASSTLEAVFRARGSGAGGTERSTQHGPSGVLQGWSDCHARVIHGDWKSVKSREPAMILVDGVRITHLNQPRAAQSNVTVPGCCFAAGRGIPLAMHPTIDTHARSLLVAVLLLQPPPLDSSQVAWCANNSG
jgi:hypothetical protein